VKIDISVRITDARQWLVALRDALQHEGHEVRFRIWGVETGRDANLSVLKMLEILCFGRGRGFWRRGELNDIAPRATDEICDIVIDLSGDPALEASLIPVLHLLVESKIGIARVMDAILARRIPSVEIRNQDGAIIQQALPALAETSIVVRALDEFYLRMITVLKAAIRQPMALVPVPPPLPSADMVVQHPLAFVLATLGQKIITRLTKKKTTGDHWRVGIRLARDETAQSGDHLIEGFTWLPDDGTRYYADPVLFEKDGRHFLFVEEYPYATRKGILSVVELDETGTPMGVPRAIVSSAKHLSYPLVFEHEGEIYLMPENAAEGRLPLFRASNFPFEWVSERDVLPGIGLHDATLVHKDGHWFLLATHHQDLGSSWDCLMVYSSPSPFGPWTADPLNPVLIDARLARSAGPVLRMNGTLIRPVQSCLGGYGRFLRFVEIDSLTPGQFRQHERGRLLAPQGGSITGVHTYSRDSRFEVIDACGEAT
jgi:hypothetical protein